jgi:DNA repair protein RecO (recombination protein O)
MEWHDSGVVLGTRALGESGRIVEVMTASHGRAAGLVRGGRSSRMRVVLQPGNVVAVGWRARLEDHLGTFTVELQEPRAGRLMETALGVFGIEALAALVRLMPERDPHPRVFAALNLVLDHIDTPANAGEAAVRFELLMLEELGFGLDLESCAATGVGEDLVWVSPRSGRAVSRAAGAPYAGKLLALPAFLGRERENAPPTRDDIRHGFRLTGHFLAGYFATHGNKPLPEARERLIAAVDRAMARAAASAPSPPPLTEPPARSA